MPLATASRGFLTAALANLGGAGFLIVLGSAAALSQRWDSLLWLLVVGFVNASTLGFSLHLFPTIAQRSLRRASLDLLALALFEGSVLLGAIVLSSPGSGPGEGPLFSVAAALLLGADAYVGVRFATSLRALRSGRVAGESRPGDAATLPLFAIAWTAAPAAAALFFAAGVAEGPGFGFWLAAVHLFLLGHAAMLITAVSLRLVPRSLGADPPRAAVFGLAGLGAVGAITIPSGMLLSSPASDGFLLLGAVPVAAFAVLFLSVLLALGARARTPKRPLALHLLAVLSLLLGGAIGVSMVARTEFDAIASHAFVNVLGFVGLTILFMWFGLVQPFQRISHAWSGRMLWVQSAGWLAAMALLAWAGHPTAGTPAWAAAGGGSILLALAAAWAIGTLPVLFPSLDPLPGVPADAIERVRRRWAHR